MKQPPKVPQPKQDELESDEVTCPHNAKLNGESADEVDTLNKNMDVCIPQPTFSVPGIIPPLHLAMQRGASGAPILPHKLVPPASHSSFGSLHDSADGTFARFDPL